MAELNLKQIIDKLNAEFTGDTRKLADDEFLNLEAWRHPVIMDLAFGDDFGF